MVGPSAAAAMATCTWCTLCRCLVLLRPPVRDARFAGAWCWGPELLLPLPCLPRHTARHQHHLHRPACQATQPVTNITPPPPCLPATSHSQSPTSPPPPCLPGHTSSHQHPSHLHRPACQVTQPVTNAARKWRAALALVQSSTPPAASPNQQVSHPPLLCSPSVRPCLQ